MARRVLFSLVTVSLLAGCGSGAPLAGLSTSALQQTAPAGPAPMVALIPGFAGPAPSVTVTAAAPMPVAQTSQTNAAAVLTSDQEAESTDLIAESAPNYQVQGLFQDIKDAIHRTLARWKLSSQIKAVLKHKNDEAFNLNEGEIDNQKSHRTAPVTKVSTLANGDQEIVTSWNSTLRGDFRIETDREVDADGVTQVLTVIKTGITKDKVALTLQRARTLTGADGSYQVVTDETQTFKNGRTQTNHWTKAVKADGTESISGYIDTPDGYRTEITGQRDAKGKVKLEVSKIAPWHNPANSPTPSPSPSSDAGATASADPTATSAG